MGSGDKTWQNNVIIGSLTNWKLAFNKIMQRPWVVYLRSTPSLTALSTELGGWIQSDAMILRITGIFNLILHLEEASPTGMNMHVKLKKINELIPSSIVTWSTLQYQNTHKSKVYYHDYNMPERILLHMFTSMSWLWVTSTHKTCKELSSNDCNFTHPNK